MERVELSARIIHWPRWCACCCGPADTAVDVSFTRRTGVKVIREQTKCWSVPYCSRCLDHMDAAADLARFGWVVVHRPAVTVVLAVILVATVFTLLTRIPVVPAILLGGVWVGAIGFGLHALLPWCVRTHREALRQRKRARRELEDELERCLCADCAEERAFAAEYDGWSGTVHTFYFSNAEFARAFRRANAGKILG